MDRIDKGEAHGIADLIKYYILPAQATEYAYKINYTCFNITFPNHAWFIFYLP